MDNTRETLHQQQILFFSSAPEICTMIPRGLRGTSASEIRTMVPRGLKGTSISEIRTEGLKGYLDWDSIMPRGVSLSEEI